MVYWWTAEFAAPNFTVPSLASALIRALVCAFLYSCFHIFHVLYGSVRSSQYSLAHGNLSVVNIAVVVKGSKVSSAIVHPARPACFWASSIIFIYSGIPSTLGLLALHNEMQRYHLEVEGVPARAPRLEVREGFLWCDFGVYCLCILELADPCISNNGEEEFCRLLSRCLVRRAVYAFRFMRRFCARAYEGRSVVID